MVEIIEDYMLNQCIDDDEKQFHSVIGHIEDILMNPDFLSVHTTFMEKYWFEFEDSDENKFEYTDIFNDYIKTIEKYIENELTHRMPNFNMEEFEKELKMRKQELQLEGEIFEILSTFSDFCAFKAMFLDYKNMKEGKSIDFSSDFFISRYGNDEAEDVQVELESATVTV